MNTGAKHQDIPTGERCHHCPATEQDCARTYPCCVHCSHLFGEVATITRPCRDCQQAFTQKRRQIRPQQICRRCRRNTPRPQRCDDPRAGTIRGYRNHMHLGDTPCQDCCDAKNTYERSRTTDDLKASA